MSIKFLVSQTQIQLQFLQYLRDGLPIESDHDLALPTNFLFSPAKLGSFLRSVGICPQEDASLEGVPLGVPPEEGRVSSSAACPKAIRPRYPSRDTILAGTAPVVSHSTGDFDGFPHLDRG